MREAGGRGAKPIKSGFRLKKEPTTSTTATSIKWAVAAKELGFPKQTDGKRIVKEWRKSRRLAVNRPVQK